METPSHTRAGFIPLADLRRMVDGKLAVADYESSMGRVCESKRLSLEH